jgi:hypothetical protein
MAVEDLGDMVGKRLLVGVTFVDASGRTVDGLELVGTVAAVAPLVAIDRGDGTEPFTLPPEPEAYEPAPPGEYRLRSTSEVVVNPDYLTTWTVRSPTDEDGDRP